MAILARFTDEPGTVLLDGGDSGWSYLAARPYRWIESDAGPEAFSLLAEALARHPAPAAAGPPWFRGGAVAVLGYELGGALERLPPPLPPDLGLPDLCAGLYDTVAAFHPASGQAFVAAPDRDRAEAFAGQIARTPDPAPPDWSRRGDWRAGIGPDAYRKLVARALDYVHVGDIFQVNLSRRFISPWPKGLSAFDLYRRLRILSPAPFAAFMNLGQGRYVLSASPERFLGLSAGGAVETRPIKGTRPRGRTPEEDAALAAELLASGKDRAENLMIVDLLRNDLSRVCALGSIAVPTLCGLESFANVHHLVSVVRGSLRPGLGAIDLLRAAFPGGSVTGAPKIRAMEIIRELEPCRRGPYCGAVAWLGFDGAMDSSVVIRTLVAGNGLVAAQAGGGIVAESDPAAEYEETMVKARASLRAVDPG